MTFESQVGNRPTAADLGWGMSLLQPCNDWRVDFTLHAPRRTVVQGSYDGVGTSASALSRHPTKRHK